MRRLFHYPLCAFSRIVRFIISEKHLDCELIYQVPWEPFEELFEYNLLGSIPLLADISGIFIHGNSAIREYLEETYPEISLINGDFQQRAEARRIADWFAFTFYWDVYLPIVDEKIFKRFSKAVNKSPEPGKVRSAGTKLSTHMEYIAWLADRRNWLAGKEFSIADIYAASFISVLDYLGIITWNKYEIAKGWYAKVKSRPGFRGILGDNLPQVPPSAEYSNPDF
ncbi:MAG: glutathione S-transferase family protein [Holosporales bacterium]|jgi:glutathione S-transferase|nr:glutathione S-transferase family protein [Holosporales bacterium]